jgi:hypothetical protein
MPARHPLSWIRNRLIFNLLCVFLVFVALIAGYTISQTFVHSANATPLSANQAFTQAAQETGVPVDLLKAICYMEGRISTNAGEASLDNGFGCMHLVKNSHFDTLDKAAQGLGVSVAQLKRDLGTNIRGGAFVLRADALTLSSTLPTSSGSYLADAKLAWLAVPAGAGVVGASSPTTHSFVNLQLSAQGSGTVPIYSRPVSDSKYVIGNAPTGAVFTTALKVKEDNATTIWYEINFNHRQAWIKASELAPFHPA